VALERERDRMDPVRELWDEISIHVNAAHSDYVASKIREALRRERNACIESVRMMHQLSTHPDRTFALGLAVDQLELRNQDAPL
jgi:hypothetical protein